MAMRTCRELRSIAQRYRASVSWPLDGWNVAWVMAKEAEAATQARLAGWSHFADYFTLDKLMQVREKAWSWSLATVGTRLLNCKPVITQVCTYGIYWVAERDAGFCLAGHGPAVVDCVWPLASAAALA